MKKLRHLRAALLIVTMLLVIAAVVTLWGTLPTGALLFGLAFTGVVSWLALVEASLWAEARNRSRLRRDLEGRLSELEAIFNIDARNRTTSARTSRILEGYRHQAQLLHRLRAVERRLGIGARTVFDTSGPKDVTQ